MLYIDKTYFIKKLHVPNTNEPTSDASIELEQSIDFYVSQFLQETLGNLLYEDLKDNTTDGGLDTDAPQKWKNLLNGCTYTKDGVEYTWKGLKYTEGTYKASILANFVYLNHFDAGSNSSLGRITLEAKNSVNLDATPHLVEIWNDFVTMYQGENTNYKRVTYFDNITFVDYFQGCKKTGYVSYLQFLKDNETDYPNVPAGYLEYQNRLGL